MKLCLPEDEYGGKETDHGGIQKIFNTLTFACVPKRAWKLP